MKKLDVLAYYFTRFSLIEIGIIEAIMDITIITTNKSYDISKPDSRKKLIKCLMITGKMKNLDILELLK